MAFNPIERDGEFHHSMRTFLSSNHESLNLCINYYIHAYITVSCIINRSSGAYWYTCCTLTPSDALSVYIQTYSESQTG